MEKESQWKNWKEFKALFPGKTIFDYSKATGKSMSELGSIKGRGKLKQVAKKVEDTLEDVMKQLKDDDLNRYAVRTGDAEVERLINLGEVKRSCDKILEEHNVKEAQWYKDMANSALQSGVGQTALGWASKGYGKLPQSWRDTAANWAATSQEGSTDKGFKPVKIQSSGGGFWSPEYWNQAKEQLTTGENGKTYSSYMNTDTMGTAGSPLAQVRNSLVYGGLPAKTFPQGNPVAQNRVATTGMTTQYNAGTGKDQSKVTQSYNQKLVDPETTGFLKKNSGCSESNKKKAMKVVAKYRSSKQTKNAEDLARAITLVKIAQQYGVEPEGLLKQAGIGADATNLALKTVKGLTSAGEKIKLIPQGTTKNLGKTIRRIATYADDPAKFVARNEERINRLSRLSGDIRADRTALDLAATGLQPAGWESKVLGKKFNIPAVVMKTEKSPWKSFEEFKKFLPDATQADFNEALKGLTSFDRLGRLSRVSDLTKLLNQKAYNVSEAAKRLDAHSKAISRYSNPINTIMGLGG